MSASARRGAIVVALAVVVGLACWRGLRSETDGGRSDARALAEKPAADEAPSEPRAPKTREKAETDSPPTDESAAPDESPPKPAPLTVRVLSAADDAPIVGATVRVEDYDKDEKRDRTATTDATGAAVVMTFALCDGPDVLVSADGYVRTGWKRTPFGAKAGDDVVVMRLAPATTLEGVVLDAKAGAPLAGAKVAAELGGECYGGQMFAEVVTDADGSFRLSGIPTTGPTRVGAAADGHVRGFVEWDGHPSRRIEIRLEPTPPGVIRGVVRDTVGAPVMGMRVRAKPDDSPCWEDDTSREDGSFEFVGLALDKAYVVWGQDLWNPSVVTAAVREVRLTLDAPVAVRDLVTTRAAELTLRVRDAAGAPVEHATISSSSVLDCLEFDWRRCPGAAGDQTAVLRRSGRFRLDVVAEGFLSHDDETVEIADGEKRVVTVILDRGAALTGVVVDDLGAPLAYALVRATPTVIAHTGKDGAFRMTGLVAGKVYRVTARDDDASASETTAPKDGLRLTTARPGFVTFRPKAGPETYVQLSFRTTDGKRSLSDARRWYGDPLELLDVPAGTYELVLVVDDFVPVSRHVVVKPGETVDLGEIVFERGVAMSGRVVDRDWRAIAGARVEAMVGGTRADHVAWTGATGAFRLFRLPSGDVTLSVAAEGFAPATFHRSAAQSPVELVLDK